MNSIQIMMEDESGFLSHDAADRDEPANAAPNSSPAAPITVTVPPINSTNLTPPIIIPASAAAAAASAPTAAAAALQPPNSPTCRTVRIQKLLATILHDLNTRRVCTTVVGETTIYLKIVSRRPDPSAVADHLVPLLHPSYLRQPADRWDLTTQQVLPFIDGVNHIARIAQESDVEVALVKACVQNLVYYGVVQLLPLLKYSNVYMCTRSLQRLTKEPALGAACRRYVALAERRVPTSPTTPTQATADEKEIGVSETNALADRLVDMDIGPSETEQTARKTTGSPTSTSSSEAAAAAAAANRPSLQKILLMYSYMTHGVNLRTLCQRTNPRENGIDER